MSRVLTAGSPLFSLNDVLCLVPDERDNVVQPEVSQTLAAGQQVGDDDTLKYTELVECLFGSNAGKSWCHLTTSAGNQKCPKWWTLGAL